MSSLGPFRTRPIYKQKIWAGGRLASLLPETPAGAGEVWLVSDVDGEASQVLDGPAAGATLRELVETRGEELLGAELIAAGVDRFPLLVKLLDIGAPLSVQVHPNAAVAGELGLGSRGKCEAWLVVEADPREGTVYLGLSEATSPEQVIQLATTGGLAERLAGFRPEPGAGLEILPGTLHTAEQVLVLEVQEPSDLTFRVFDWGRGRALHLEEARRCLEVVGPRVAPGPTARGWTRGSLELAPGAPFRFQAVEVAGGEHWRAESAGPQVLVVVEGSVRVASPDGVQQTLAAGEAVVIPACRGSCAVTAQGTARFGHAAT